MAVFQATYADASLRTDGKAEVRFRTKAQHSISVTIPASALHALGERIAEITAPETANAQQGRARPKG